MPDITFDDNELTLEQERAHREWARKKCKEWNWNADAAEIAKELIDLDVEPDSRQFEILCEEFNTFFNHPKMDVAEAIEQIMESFA